MITLHTLKPLDIWYIIPNLEMMIGVDHHQNILILLHNGFSPLSWLDPNGSINKYVWGGNTVIYT